MGSTIDVCVCMGIDRGEDVWAGARHIRPLPNRRSFSFHLLVNTLLFPYLKRFRIIVNARHTPRAFSPLLGLPSTREIISARKTGELLPLNTHKSFTNTCLRERSASICRLPNSKMRARREVIGEKSTSINGSALQLIDFD